MCTHKFYRLPGTAEATVLNLVFEVPKLPVGTVFSTVASVGSFGRYVSFGSFDRYPDTAASADTVGTEDTVGTVGTKFSTVVGTVASVVTVDLNLVLI